MPKSRGTRSGSRTKAARAKGTREIPEAIPETMKVAAIDRFGPPEALTLHVLPVPEPRDDEVLVALYAAGVGVWDKWVRDGSWRPGGTKFPLIPGTDGAGMVVARGPKARRFRIGDRVWAYDYSGGFYAEYNAVRDKYVDHAPERLDWLQAGAGATTGFTALQGIDGTLHVRRGETVLIFGGTGAVGTVAIQFAKRKGARVITTASGRAAAALVSRLGADAWFDARRDDAVGKFEELVPDGIDAALVLAGSPVLEKFLDFLGRNGRVAYPNGVAPAPKKRRGIPVTGYDGVAGATEFSRLNRAVEEAELEVPIARAYPLAQAARAHERLEERHILGRLALRIRRDVR